MILADRLKREIQALGNKYSVEKIVLFGSRARGDHEERSDIDLAIFPGGDFSQEGQFASEVEELSTLLKIDLVFVTSLVDKDLLADISRQGVVLYERQPKKTC